MYQISDSSMTFLWGYCRKSHFNGKHIEPSYQANQHSATGRKSTQQKLLISSGLNNKAALQTHRESKPEEFQYFRMMGEEPNSWTKKEAKKKKTKEEKNKLCLYQKQMNIPKWGHLCAMFIAMQCFLTKELFSLWIALLLFIQLSASFNIQGIYSTVTQTATRKLNTVFLGKITQ